VLKTDENGYANFRGFYGNYQVRVTMSDGTTRMLDLHLKEKGDNKWEFKL
jgi:hypothetical protein